MADLDGVFRTLRGALLEAAPALEVRADDESKLSLYQADEFFAAVQLGKRYVSVHLMPLYGNDALRAAVPAALEGRLKGKTCFNFTRLEAGQLEQVKALVRRALGVSEG